MELTFQNFQSEYQTYSEIENHFLEQEFNNIGNVQVTGDSDTVYMCMLESSRIVIGCLVIEQVKAIKNRSLTI